MQNPVLPKKAALFVDFDNIYRALQDVDSRAAARFAQQPAQWLGWFAKGFHQDSEAEELVPLARSILVRRCYLSPHAFGEFRPFYTRAGFSVIDCPALTGRGKNSADIVMVMDVLDALEHQTRFDEFIILSGDADFTPVLLRLRAHDRRTVVVTNALTAAAYRAATDISVHQETFIEDALGIEEAEVRLPRIPSAAISLEDIAQSAVQYLGQHGRVPPAELIPIFKEHPSFSDSRWFGFGTLRKLCEKIIEIRPQIVIEGADTTSWTIGIGQRDVPSIASPAIATPQVGSRREQILQLVRHELASSDYPMQGAHLGNLIIRQLKFNFKETDWEGAGTLRELLRSANDPHIAIHTIRHPGGSSIVVYDPGRHTIGTELSERPGLSQSLAELIEKVTNVTGCPRLQPEEYRLLFGLIAEYPFGLEFNPNQASADIRDICRDRGKPIGRANISFVLTAFRFRRYDMNTPNKHPVELATVFKRNIIDLSQNASLPLSAADIALLDEWLGSSSTGVAEQPSEGDAKADDDDSDLYSASPANRYTADTTINSNASDQSSQNDLNRSGDSLV
jgi:hypothetical protein